MPMSGEREETTPHSESEKTNRTKPTGGRTAEDALPATPKYKSLDKTQNEQDGGNRSRSEQQRECHFGDESGDTTEDMRVCTIVPRHRPIPPYFVHNDFTQPVKQSVYQIHASRFTETIVKPALFHLAKTAAHRRLIFVLLPILFVSATICGPIYYWDQLNILAPFNTFISGSDPTQAPTIDLRLNNVNFNGTNPAFDAIRRTSQAEFAVLMTTRSHFTNIISNSSLNAYSRLLNDVHNISVQHSFLSLQWEDICREDCQTENPIATSLRSKKVVLKYPDAIVADDVKQNKRLFFANFFGDLEWDSDGVVTRAHAINVGLKMKETLKPETYAEFERKLQDRINERQTDNEVRFYVWSVRGFMREAAQMLRAAHWRLLPCGAVLVIFCFLITIRGDSYKTRPFVGLQTGLILVLCAAVGYAVQIAGAGQLNAIAFPVLFVIVSCGILVYYYMLSAWNRYSSCALHPVEKLTFIYSWDGPNMVLSLLTAISTSVVVGLLAQLQYVQTCFFILAAGLTAVLAFGLFYMTVCWYGSGRREAEGLKWWQLIKRGDQSFNEKCVLDYDQSTAGLLHQKMTDLKPSFSRLVGKSVANSALRTVTVVGFTIYIIFAVIGAQQTRVQLREEHFLQRNSSSSQYLQKYQHAFKKYEYYVELIFDANLDYYDKDQRALALDLITTPVRDQYATKAVSWLLEFEQFQDKSIYEINADTIVPIVNYVFLSADSYQKYSTDIVFDKFKTQIIKSRSYLELSSKGVDEIHRVVEILQQKAAKARIPLTIRTPLLFSLHHDLQVLQKLMFAFITLLVAITVLTLLLFGQMALSLSVLFSCVVVSIGIFGYSTYLLIPINVVTLTTLLLGNIFTAMITIHFCYAFINSGVRHQSSVARVQYAFQCCLWPNVVACIAIGGLFFPLPLAIDAPVLLHIWKTLAAVAVITFLHFVLVLPSVMVVFTESVSRCCHQINRACNENGCFGVEQPTESIYFVPASERQLKMIANYSNYGVAALDGPLRRMVLGPGEVSNAPPDYAVKPSILFNSGGLAYSPRRTDHCRIREADSEPNSRPSSTRMSRPQTASQHHTPRGRRLANGQRLDDNDSINNEEQIYEEPESPAPQRSATTNRNARFRSGLPRDEFVRMDQPMPPNWRQFIDNRSYPMPYSSPSSFRRYM
ncbi:Patched family-containing protein [Aphelenchoides besseyi]|nr:Patched family-containing protein [Aphelenchoides besseyi]